MYDITSLDSFAGAKTWAEELKRRTKACVITMVGNKCDLETDRKVEHVVASEYALTNGYMHMDTSAKTALNVQELFRAIAEEMRGDAVSRRFVGALSVSKPRNYYNRCC